MKPLIIGWLAARGMALANEASDQAVITAVQTAFDQAGAGAAALGNEKNTLSAALTALTNEKNTLATKNGELTSALANAQSARQAERKHAAAFAVDLAIQRGRKSVADREAAIAALENSADLAAEAKALLAAKPVIKTEAISGRQQAALDNEAQQTHAEYQAAFKTELVATGQNPIQAHNNIMRLPQYAGLAAKLVPKKF